MVVRMFGKDSSRNLNDRLARIAKNIHTNRNYSGGCKAKYHTLLEGVWLSDIGRMGEVRNVPHLACKV